MRIDYLKTSADRAGRFTVRFDDGSAMRLYRQTIEDFGLYSGMELTEDAYSRLKQAAGEMSAKMRAVRIVSAASVSRRDLQNRLIRKGENPDQAEQAVEWLSDLHLVDDRNTAEQIVHSCIARGYGKARAKQALYEKQIPREYWEEALEDYPDQQDAIIGFLRSRLTDPADQRARKRAIDALLRRGHSYQAIRRALSELSMETDDFPEEE